MDAATSAVARQEPAIHDATQTKPVGDLRADRRVKTHFEGEIDFGGTAARTACRIRDLSESGAKIEIDQSHPFPPVVSLDIPELNTTFRAELRWRYANTVGVKFIASERLARAEERPTRAALLAENARLQDTIKALSDRLTQLGEPLIDGALWRGPVPRSLKQAANAPAKQPSKSGRARRGEQANSRDTTA